MSIEVPLEYAEVATLAVAAALENDDQAVRHLLLSLPTDQALAAAEAVVLAMAEMLRTTFTAETMARLAAEARRVAREAADQEAQEGNTP